MTMNYTELKQLVAKHSHEYYDLNRPTITDQEWDSLYDQLCAIENKQGWRDPDSPTLTNFIHYRKAMIRQKLVLNLALYYLNWMELICLLFIAKISSH